MRTPPPLDPPEDLRILERYLWAGLVFMAILIVAFPIYRAREKTRLETAHLEMRKESIALGQELYGLHCASCHGPEGRGGRIAPTLQAEELLENVTNEQLSWLIAAGVPGTTMPAYDIDHGGPLTPQEIDQLVAYLRSLEEDAPSVPGWREGEPAPPPDEEDRVAQAASEPVNDAPTSTAAEVAAAADGRGTDEDGASTATSADAVADAGRSGTTETGTDAETTAAAGVAVAEGAKTAPTASTAAAARAKTGSATAAAQATTADASPSATAAQTTTAAQAATASRDQTVSTTAAASKAATTAAPTATAAAQTTTAAPTATAAAQTATAAAPTATAEPTPSDSGERTASAERLYLQHCAACHGFDRGGTQVAGELRPPLGKSHQALVEVISQGVSGTAMVAFARDAGGPLDAAAIEAIARWLKRSGG